MKNDNKVQFFSENTGNFYQLLPTKTVPVLRINGVAMHRFAKIDPKEHVKRIIDAAKPHGNVLDICTGLGYCAIEEAKRKEVLSVTTIEKDGEIIELAKMNNASAQLFKNQKIKILQGNAYDKIKELKSNSFDCIIHDPPTYVISPELYSHEFYEQLMRVLKPKGKLWHYGAEPGKARAIEKGEKLIARIMRNLEETGFVNISHDDYSKGVLAEKN